MFDINSVSQCRGLSSLNIFKRFWIALWWFESLVNNAKEQLTQLLLILSITFFTGICSHYRVKVHIIFFLFQPLEKKITTNYKCDAGMLFYLVTTTMTTRIHLKPKDLKAKLRTKELTNEHLLQHKSKLQTRMTARERLIFYLLSAWERVKRTWERERETKSMKVESRFFSPDFFKYYAFLRRERERERERGR